MNIAEARAERDAARAQLEQRFADTRYRLSPSTLARNALDRSILGLHAAANKGEDALRSRPMIFAAATAGAITLFLSRHWIKRKLLGEPSTANPAPKPRKTGAKTAKKGSRK